jgi:hypothetical protein
VLNDIGPVIEADGLARIGGYVGQGRSYLTWMHAARGLHETMGEIYPDFAIGDWLRLAKRLMALGTGGRIAFDYDMKIAVPIEAAEGPRRGRAGDRRSGRRRPISGPCSPPVRCRWWSSMARCRTFSRRDRAGDGQRHPIATLVTLPRVGHAPTLDEPEARAAIDRLLPACPERLMVSSGARPHVLHLHSSFDAGARSGAAWR